MNKINTDSVSANILAWYDVHKRELPWRKDAPDPYHVLLSEMMLQQTTVATVKDYFNRFTTKWPRIEDLANAPEDDVMAQWAGLGYYARARNLIKTAGAIAKMGAFPRSAKELQKLPGIGPYTAAAIASIAFDEAVLPRDGNINRILARLFDIDDPIDRPSVALTEASAQFSHPTRAGDLAQAMMDMGAGICRPKNPKCDECAIADFCRARAQGKTEALPVKAPKIVKRDWKANVFVTEKPDGAIGFVRREAHERLGGLWALPSSDWTDAPEFEPPFEANWQDCGTIRHVFTHIDLKATVYHAPTPKAFSSNALTFFSQKELPSSSLPRLWGKVLEKFEATKDK